MVARAPACRTSRWAQRWPRNEPALGKGDGPGGVDRQARLTTMHRVVHQVAINHTGETFPCAEDVHVLAAMEQARCHGIPVGCRNGGCGACKVRITAGRFEVRKMNRAVLSADEEAQGCVLACKAYPRGDIEVHVLGRVWQHARPPRARRSVSGLPGRPRKTNPTRRHKWQ